jgi:hypothetical protein
MPWWQFAGSLAAVAALVVLSWKLGFSGPPELLDEAEARAVAAEVAGGFDPVAVALDTSRTGAILRDSANRIAIVGPSGAHFLARLLGAGARATSSNGRLEVRDHGFEISLDLGNAAADWANAIDAIE